MSEQSPFDLYGKLLTAYVDACVEVNRAWFANATRLGAGFFTPFPPLRPTQPNRSTGAAATAETFAPAQSVEAPSGALNAEALAGESNVKTRAIESFAAFAPEPLAVVEVESPAVVHLQPSASTLESADMPGFPNTNGTSAGPTQAAVAPRAEAVAEPTHLSEPDPVTEDGASDVAVESGAVEEQRDLMAEVRPSEHGPSLGDLVINDVPAMSSSHTGLGAISTTRIDPDVLGAVNDLLQPHMESAALPSDAPQGPTRAKRSPKRSRKPKSR